MVGGIEVDQVPAPRSPNDALEAQRPEAHPLEALGDRSEARLVENLGVAIATHGYVELASAVLSIESVVAGAVQVDEATGPSREALWQLGADVPDPEGAVDELGLPSLAAAYRLAAATRATAAGDTDAARRSATSAVELCETADIPLPLHVQALVVAALPVRARTLVRSVADRLPDRRTRRRFARAWERVEAS